MSFAERVANSIGKGSVAGIAGTAAMTVSSTLEAKLRHRAPSTAPARGAAVWAARRYVAGARHCAAVGVLAAREEIVIDLFHHAVYALATGIAYDLLSGGAWARNGGPTSGTKSR